MKFIILLLVIMSQTLKRNAAFLKLLHKAGPELRKSILRTRCTSDFVKCISECCRNVLKGNVPLTNTQSTTLRRKKKILRALALKKTSQKNKKRLIQNGGFLGFLLGPIVSILSNLLGSASSQWNTLKRYYLANNQQYRINLMKSFDLLAL